MFYIMFQGFRSLRNRSEQLHHVYAYIGARMLQGRFLFYQMAFLQDAILAIPNRFPNSKLSRALMPESMPALCQCVSRNLKP